MANAIVRFFMRARHWQLFLLFLLPQTAGFVALVSIIALSDYTSSTVPAEVSVYLFGAITQLATVGWYWAIGSFSYTLLAPSRDLNIHLFQLSSVFLAIGPFIFAMVWQFNVAYVSLIITFTAISVLFFFSGFYVLYFSSKCLGIVSRGRTVEFGGDVRTFFELWFFPIGVWLIQPRVNQIYAEKNKFRPFNRRITSR